MAATPRIAQLSLLLALCLVVALSLHTVLGLDRGFAGGATEPQSAIAGTNGNIFTVDTTSDTDAVDTFCSLREAIKASNLNMTYNDCIAATSGIDTNSIIFALGAGVPTINVITALPFITRTVEIDGNTGGATRIEIAGPGVNEGLNGFVLIDPNAAGTSINRLVINGFGESAILVSANNFTITGSYIGTNAAGTAAVPNLRGIYIAGADNAFIGGTSGVTPGGPCTGDCNLISGNSNIGLYLSSGAKPIVNGNFIGTNAAGDAAIPNGNGVRAQTDAWIGGAGTDEGNLISGNTIGVNIPNHSMPPARILGNLIGTDASGQAAVGNGTGIRIVNAGGTIVGSGEKFGAGNVISGNTGDGILLSANEVLIHANFIGTTATGEGSLGNGGRGIVIEDNSMENKIGFTSLESGNVIANSNGHGVAVVGSTGNIILNNSIFDNGGLGIDLAADGVTPNDPMDADDGPNDLQNFPVITMVSADAGGTRVQALLNSEPNTEFIIQYFDNDDCDPSGHGEGQRLLPGFAIGVTDGNGDVILDNILPVDFSSLHFVTATANGDGTHNASEYSGCFTIEQPSTPTPAPTPSPSETPSGTATATPGPGESPTVTPTPTPSATASVTPTPGEAYAWGDANCSGGVDPVDALLTLRHDAGLSVNTFGCPAFGTSVEPVVASALAWGDFDCSGGLDPVDALKLLRVDAGLNAAKIGEPCPDPGDPVSVSAAD
ncbi:MAG TPA: CSLREA domain-containing protein [Dehalococcoidia bacterium]|nr:CSLREA domain-containing protein [Dehalococcoidia bacterium]